MAGKYRNSIAHDIATGHGTTAATRRRDFWLGMAFWIAIMVLVTVACF